MNVGKGKRRLMSEINVVPYIDVMLVLLIIFMITAPLLTQGISVDLPNAPAQALDEELLRALPSLPDCAGVALGFDRLVALATGQNDLKSVLAFAHGKD